MQESQNLIVRLEDKLKTLRLAGRTPEHAMLETLAWGLSQSQDCAATATSVTTTSLITGMRVTARGVNVGRAVSVIADRGILVLSDDGTLHTYGLGEVVLSDAVPPTPAPLT